MYVLTVIGIVGFLSSLGEYHRENIICFGHLFHMTVVGDRFT